MPLNLITASSNSALMSKLIKEIMITGKSRSNAVVDAIIEMKKRGIKFKKVHDHIVAKEGVLTYPGVGRGLKLWSDLKKWIGKTTLITDDHPLTEGVNDTTPIFGMGIVKKCPIGANLLCVDKEILEETPKRSGHSLGYNVEMDWTKGQHGSEQFDFIQNLKELDHIALTDFPRDRNALVTDSTIFTLQSNKNVNKFAIAYDSYNITNNNNNKKMDVKKMPTIEELQALLAQQKAELKAEKDARKAERDGLDKEIAEFKKEQLKIQEKELQNIVDSLKKTWEFEDSDLEGLGEKFLRGAKWALDKVSVKSPKSNARNISNDSNKKQYSNNDLVYKNGKLEFA